MRNPRMWWGLSGIGALSGPVEPLVRSGRSKARDWVLRKGRTGDGGGRREGMGVCNPLRTGS